MPDFRGPKKNSQIHREMAAELRRKGLRVNDADVKTKINNMTSKYRKELLCSADGPSTWRHFKRMQFILGNRRRNSVTFSETSLQISDNIKLENGVAESAPEAPSSRALEHHHHRQSASLSSGEEFILPSPIVSAQTTSPPHHLHTPVSEEKCQIQSRLLTSISELRQEFKDEMHKLQQADAQLIALEREKISLLRKQVNDAAELKDGVLKFLSEIGSHVKVE